MAAGSHFNYLDQISRHDDGAYSFTYHDDVDKITEQLTNIIEALKNNTWSKGHWTSLEILKDRACTILETSMITRSLPESNDKLKVAVDKAYELNTLIVNDQRPGIDGLKDIITKVSEICRRNLITAYNFQTIQVPEEIQALKVWHGESIKAEYLAIPQIYKSSIDAFISDRSEKLIQKGEYLIRPCTSALNKVRDRIDFFVLEYRSNSTGRILKNLFTFNHNSQLFVGGKGQTFKTFESYRNTVIPGAAKEIQADFPKVKSRPLKCSTDEDTLLADSLSPFRTSSAN